MTNIDGKKSKRGRLKPNNFGIRPGLGMDLVNIVRSTEENIGVADLHVIPLDKIIIENNPRSSIALQPIDIIEGIRDNDPLQEDKLKQKEALSGLAASIKDKGVLYPVHVYKKNNKYVLVMGQRRCLAALIAGRKTIQSKVWMVKPDEYDLKIWQNIENSQRENLSSWEKLQIAKLISELYNTKFHKKINATELGRALYCKKVQGKLYFDLINAPKDIHEALESGDVTSLRNAYEISKLLDPEKRKKLIEQLKRGDLTANTLSLLILNIKKEKSQKTNISSKKRGRQSTRVTLGTTENMSVAQEIIEIVLAKKTYSGIRKEFKDIDWDDYKSVSIGFKKLITYMESFSSE